jgi:transposase
MAPIAPAEVSAPQAKRPATKARGKRRPLDAVLTRVDVVHDVEPGEHTCPCGTPMVEIG